MASCVARTTAEPIEHVLGWANEKAKQAVSLRAWYLCIKLADEEVGLWDLYCDAVDEMVVLSEKALQKERIVFRQQRTEITEIFSDLSGIRHLLQVDIQDKERLAAIHWNNAQIELDIGYIMGTELLIDCLQLATVANRSEIEERLLLPARSALVDGLRIDH